MQNSKLINWVLRIAIAGEFIGHGIFSIGFFPASAVGKSIYFIPQKAQWVGWIHSFTGADMSLSAQLLTIIGVLDLCLALLVLMKPIRAALLWMTFWGFWTALLRPLVGELFWDFVERSANWGAPLALLLLIGWPKNIKEWFN